MAMTRQQLEQQLVAAHRTKNVQAAQQAAYAIRAYDQNMLSAQVPSINAPPPIDRVPKPTFGSWLGNVTAGIGEGLGEQVQGLGGAIQRGVTAFAQDPLKASAAAFMTALEPARQGFTQPVQAAKDVGTGIVETGKQMYQQATSGPIGLGQTIGQMIDLPGPSLPGGKRRPTMAELDVYHGTPHTFDPEEGAPLGRFRSSKIGTGEGAQVYGYGLYLAESPDVAGEYRDRLSTKVTVNGSQLQTIPSDSPSANAHNMVVTNVQKGLSPKDAIAATKKYWTDAANEMLALVESHPELAERIKKEASSRMEIANSAESLNPESFYRHPGSLYKVDLPDAKIEQMLDWDKPLAEQPESVRKAIADVGVTPESLGKTAADKVRRLAQAEGVADWAKRDLLADAARLESAKSIQQISGTLKNMQLDYGINPDSGPFASSAKDFLALVRATEYLPNGDTGASAYRLLSALRGGDAAASEYMRSLGVPGIKYLDAGSRASEKGTRNFVVFPGEEQSLTILERDGVKAEVPEPVAPVIDTTKPKREQLRQLHQQSGVSFVDATIDRGGAHTPAGPNSGSPAYDVSLNGTYPEDFYGANGLRYYGTGYDEMDRKAYDKLRRLEGNPNSAVEVYRAVEKDGPKTISPGDWVTTVRDYAKDHGESALNGDYKIIKMLVNARDIYTAGDSMLEWGYHPQPRMPQLPKATK